ncbi:thioesterase family protein [Escherichia coli]|nr:thioesterase family protein [Escherichia coli]
MSAVLTAEQALKLVGEMFVYHMPFNRALGMELERYEKEFAQLAFKNQPMMVGNWAQSILHGGVIASALDVAAGLVCVGSTLTRHETISEDELRSGYRGWGPLIFALIICAQAGASVLLLLVACCVQAIKSPSPALNYTMKNSFILPVPPPPIW